MARAPLAHLPWPPLQPLMNLPQQQDCLNLQDRRRLLRLDFSDLVIEPLLALLRVRLVARSGQLQQGFLH